MTLLEGQLLREVSRSVFDVGGKEGVYRSSTTVKFAIHSSGEFDN